MENFLRPRLYFSPTLSDQPRLARVGLWICDRRVLKRTPALTSWIRDQGGIIYAVVAGEELKALENFPSHMTEIAKRLRQARSADIMVAAVGGGTVGDFAGFVASTFKRGVSLVQIPTTWLAALDSAHGGKNALNIGPFKNQVGTFHMPSEIRVIKELLDRQPPHLATAALGELVKIALIEGNSLWKDLLTRSAEHEPAALLWRLLKPGVAAKYRVVARDPWERKGLRQVLNLGHTLGHVWEGQWAWPHGEAVLQGIYFSLAWSRERGLLSQRNYQTIIDQMSVNLGLRDRALALAEQRPFRLTRKRMEQALMADKKRRGEGEARFIFVRAPGQTLVRQVQLSEILDEAARQGWLSSR